jgi:membrane-bound metal-dependent hydrolase YbcI (DUF457 family)
VPLERRFGHRTITHSLLALGLVAGLAYLLVPPWWPLLGGAYASHLAIDLLIGRQGIMLLWPSGEFLTLTAWRDDGPAPRVLLLILLPAVVLAALWPQLGPLLTPRIAAAVAVANPISTPTPTKAPTPQPTERPSITLSFELPAGVGLSALKVRAGDTIAEGQVLAQWEQKSPTPWPTLTPPATSAPPAAPITSVDYRAAVGHYEMPWSAVVRIEVDPYRTNLVFQGDGQRLVIPGPLLWSGRQKAVALALLQTQIQRYQLTVRETPWAAYKLPKNTKVS